ncbi:uncharacterized protein A4U43_C04F9170 [Asparagus officinalis]|uniref:Uncharacterized protein n=1 Tax=Asparagus officinalis TaxID=4686 RepID=A0A5P1EZF1_ASPOF|nr:uncharacterized protein A4U43_C04F9170 [Asparagus officinalis]
MCQNPSRQSPPIPGHPAPTSGDRDPMAARLLVVGSKARGGEVPQLCLFLLLSDLNV